MSRRQLRRLQELQGVQEKVALEVEEEDEEDDSATGNALAPSPWGALSGTEGKKKKKKKKQQQKQAKQGSSDQTPPTPVSDEELSPAPEVNFARRPPRSGPRPSRPPPGEAEGDEEAQLDRILRDFHAKTRTTPAPAQEASAPKWLALLRCEAECLDPDQELRRMIGRTAGGGRVRGLAAAAAAGKRGNKPFGLRKAILVKPKNTWPPYSSHGLQMVALPPEPPQGGKMGYTAFTFQVGADYAAADHAFDAVAAFHDPQGLVALSHRFPYHLRTLYELSIAAQLMGDAEQTTDLLGRALYGLEAASRAAGFPWLDPVDRHRRLPWGIEDNEIAFDVLHRWTHLLSRAGNYRTAMEVTKMLLSLDPERDPCGALLSLDFYAVRAAQWTFLHEFRLALGELAPGLKELPGMMYFDALGTFLHEVTQGAGDAESYRGDSHHQPSSSLLDEAIRLHPVCLRDIQRKVTPDASMPWLDHPLFTSPHPSPVTAKLYEVVQAHGADLWKRPHVQGWLESGVTRALRLIAAGDVSLDELAAQRFAWSEHVAIQVYRDIRVSELFGQLDALPADDPRPDEADLAAILGHALAAHGAPPWAAEMLGDLGPLLQAVEADAANVAPPPEEEDDFVFPE